MQKFRDDILGKKFSLSIDLHAHGDATNIIRLNSDKIICNYYDIHIYKSI